MQTIENFKTTDIEEKRQIIINAGEQKDPEAIEPLVSLLPVENELTYEIIWALGKIGDSRTCQAILHYINDIDPRIKSASIEALGEIGCNSDEVIEALFVALNDDSDHIHWQSSWALGKIGGSKITKKLIKRLVEDNHRDKWHIVYALGMIGDRKALGVLTQMLKKYKDIHMKRNIIFALKSISDPMSREIFETYKNDQDCEVRHYAIEALSVLNNTDS